MGLLLAIGVFALSAAVVIAAAIYLAKSGDVIANKSGWGRLWVGSLLVAGATSLPELVTNVSAVRIGAPGLAVGNIFGANMLNAHNVAALGALLGGKFLFSKLLPQQALLATFATVLTGISFVFVLLEPQLKWLGVSPAALIIIVAYIFGFRILSRYSSESVEASEEGDKTLLWGWVVFGLSSLAIFASAPFLAISANRIADLIGVSKSFVGVLAVALITTAPELTTAIAAFRMGAPDLGVAGLYGSNAFNVAVLAVADLFYTDGSLFASLDRTHFIAGLFAILLMALGTIQFFRRRPQKLISVTEPSTLIMSVIYVLGLYLVFRSG